MNFTNRDGKRLSSKVWHQEQLLHKKRRWLAGTPPITTSEVRQKSKRPKFLTDEFLRESYLRKDEVSFEAIRTSVEKSFGSIGSSKGAHHVVQDGLQLFDIHNKQSYSVNSSDYLRKLYATMNLLSNRALFHVANFVTDKRVGFEKTRPRMKKIIKKDLPKVLAESDDKYSLTLWKQLSLIFRDPQNFQEKHLNLRTPISQSLLSSIHNVLKELDEMPLQDLLAMNRKLRDDTLVPQFPPVFPNYKRDLLVRRVRKRCENFLKELEEGADLPKPFAKALSVVCLSRKKKSRCVTVLTSEFYPFSSETEGLHNDILRAVWSLQKAKISELKALQFLVDPEAKVSWRSFRTALRNYLVEHLFECDVIDVPDELLSILASLNRRSRRQPLLFSSALMDEEVEAVPNVSSQLKQIVSNRLPDCKLDEKLEGMESDDDSVDNDFEFADDYCPYLDEHEQEKEFTSCLNGENTGDSWTVAECQQHKEFTSSLHGQNPRDSWPVAYAGPIPTDQSHSLQFAEACTIGGTSQKTKLTHEDNCLAKRDLFQQSKVYDSTKLPKMEKDDDRNSQPCPKGIELQTKHGIEHMEGALIQDICDDTSLIAYKLIGHVLDRFLQTEGRNTDEMTRHYLLGHSAPPLNSSGAENSSDEDVGIQILIQAAAELLPSMRKSSLERVKNFMGKPQH